MGKTLDLGIRIELQPLDSHCRDISLGLYCRDVDGVSRFQVHTYSSVEGAQERVEFINEALIVMGGLEGHPEDGRVWLRFPCGSTHERAIKRIFLDLCKLETGAALEPKPLTAFDKKAASSLTAVSLDGGVYEIRAEAGAEKGPRRAEATAGGFAKLCEMEFVGDNKKRVVFPCQTNHDALIGLLMFRAQNVRAAMREAETAATRGILSSPSQQE